MTPLKRLLLQIHL